MSEGWDIGDAGNWAVFMKNAAPLCMVSSVRHTRCCLLQASLLPQAGSKPSWAVVLGLGGANSLLSAYSISLLKPVAFGPKRS